MLNPERPDKIEERIRTIHQQRVNRLVRWGILDLIVKHGHPRHIGGDGLGMEFPFTGSSTVNLQAIRNKLGLEERVWYSELVQLYYDGSFLTVEGAHLVFIGTIPRDQVRRDALIGNAIKAAFEEPRRNVMDPRKVF